MADAEVPFAHWEIWNFHRQYKLIHTSTLPCVICALLFQGAKGSNGSGPIHYRGITITLRNTRPPQRPLTDNTQHSQETDIRAPVGFGPAITTKRGRKPTPQTARPPGSVLYLVL